MANISHDTKYFIGKTGASFLIQVFGAALAFGLQIFIAREIGHISYGHYAFVIQMLILLTIFAKFGLDITVIRFIPEYISKDHKSKLKGIFFSSFLITFLSSIIISFIVVIIIYAISDDISHELKFTCLIGLSVLPLLALIQIFESILKSVNCIIKAIYPQKIIRPIIFLVIISISEYFVTNNLYSTNIILMYFVANIIVFLVLAYYIFKHYTIYFKYIAASYDIIVWLKYSVPMLMMSAFAIINTRSDVILIGILKNTTYAGYYSAADKWANLVLWGIISINTVVAPIISKYFARNKIYELQTMLIKSILLVAVISLPIALFIIINGRYLLNLYGEEFIIAYASLITLVVSYLLNALAGPVGYLLSLTGYHKEASLVMAISAIANIILNFIFIPKYGMIGAAVATLVSTILWNCSMYLLCIRYHRIDPTIISPLTYYIYLRKRYV
jgi:O-antigen/teichoic acid export membrane protein